MRVSKSNKVCGYVKAVQRLHGLEMKLGAREERLLPLRRRVTEARAAMLSRRQRLTGSQIGESERLLGPFPAATEHATGQRRTHDTARV